jgi:hypothetical protein
LSVAQGNCRAPLGTRLAPGERAYVQLATGDSADLVVHESPGQAKVLGSIPVGRTVRVLRGPVCQDDMAWWMVWASGKSGLRGWVSEGSPDQGFYLVPLEVRQERPGPGVGGHGQPTFRGDAIVKPSENTMVVFSPDGEVASCLFSDLIAELSPGGNGPQRKFITPVLLQAPGDLVRKQTA